MHIIKTLNSYADLKKYYFVSIFALPRFLEKENLIFCL
jgi:hypothetical protein